VDLVLAHKQNQQLVDLALVPLIQLNQPQDLVLVLLPQNH
jgi:hypothetical protein